MNIHFWGVRGSIPTPVSPAKLKSKISAIIEQITPEDLESAESRELFLSELPPWLSGTVGGNSSCVSVTFDNPPKSSLAEPESGGVFPSDECIVFDCGSGIREMGIAHISEKRGINQYHIFMSHFHWDHIQGLPFFIPAYNPAVNINFYSPVASLEKILSDQMVSPYFPVPISVMGSRKKFIYLENDINLYGHTVKIKKMNHPGGSYAYCINDNGKRLIYATDIELTSGDFLKNEENTSFFKDADLIIIDCQYTLGEAIEKYNWGHSAFSLAVDFAANWNIKRMVMFHHDPAYDDHKLYSLLQTARWYLERMNLKKIELIMACEGLEISL